MRRQFLTAAAAGACLAVFAAAHAQTGGSAGAGATAGAAAAAARTLPDAQQIIQFLDRTIAWYRDRAAERQLATEPADVLALSDSRATAMQIVQQGFAFARAAAVLVRAPAIRPAPAGNSDQLQQLAALQARLEQQAQPLQQQLELARGSLSHASAATRRTIQAHMAALQAQSDLLRARRDAVHELLAFLAGGANGAGTALSTQIETLAGSVAAENVAPVRTGTGAAAAARAPVGTAASAPTNGIWDLTARLLSLSAKIDRINQSTQQTDALAQVVGTTRARLLLALRSDSSAAEQAMNRPSAAPGASGAVAELSGEQGRLDGLTAQFKSITASMVPLFKLSVLLGQYHSQLDNWRDGVHQQYARTLRNLAIRIGVVVFVLVLVLAASDLWRRAVKRYVRDARRRYQFLLLRRFALWFIIAIILASTLASRLDSFVTFAGLLTAGIAVAMQNVILSVVGYFFLIGKYGIRVGDRVQIGDVHGEIIDVGLVRMHLMEYGRVGLGPTGRVAAFSNSIVFQSSTAVFKQIPGVHFAWHVMTVTLAHATNGTVVRERLLTAVEAALAHYREDLDRQNQEIARAAFAMPGGALHASVQLRFVAAGLQAVVRYPVDQNRAAEIDEAVSRELLEAIERAPKLQGNNTVAPQLDLNLAPEA